MAEPVGGDAVPVAFTLAPSAPTAAWASGEAGGILTPLSIPTTPNQPQQTQNPSGLATAGLGFSALSLSGLTPGARPTDPLPSGLCSTLNYDARRIFCGPTRILRINSDSKRRVALGSQTWIQFYSATAVTVMCNQRFLCEVPAGRGIVHTFWAPTSEGAQWELFVDYNVKVPPGSSDANQDFMVDTEMYVRAVFSYTSGDTPTPYEALVGPAYVRFSASSFLPVDSRYLPGVAGATVSERRTVIGL